MKPHTTALVCMTVLLAIPAAASPARHSVPSLSKRNVGRRAADRGEKTYTLAPYSYAITTATTTTSAGTSTSSADAISGIPNTTSNISSISAETSSSLPPIESYESESASAPTYESSSVLVTSSADALSESGSTSLPSATVTAWLSDAVTVTTTLWKFSSSLPPLSSTTKTISEQTCSEMDEMTTLTRTAFITATATLAAPQPSIVSSSNSSNSSNSTYSTTSVGTSAALPLSTFSSQSWFLTVPWTNSSGTQTFTALSASGGVTGGEQPHVSATQTLAQQQTVPCHNETVAGGAARTTVTSASAAVASSSLSRSQPSANSTTTTTTTTRTQTRTAETETETETETVETETVETTKTEFSSATGTLKASSVHDATASASTKLLSFSVDQSTASLQLLTATWTSFAKQEKPTTTLEKYS